MYRCCHGFSPVDETLLLLPAGFCHWPQPAWRRPDGTWVPSQANFTSLASPDAVGSGKTVGARCTVPLPLRRLSACCDAQWKTYNMSLAAAVLRILTAASLQALMTLLHEGELLHEHCSSYDADSFSAALTDHVQSIAGGHAAHFANVNQYSPFFSQERAPTSVSDSLLTRFWHKTAHWKFTVEELRIVALEEHHHAGLRLTAHSLLCEGGLR